MDVNNKVTVSVGDIVNIDDQYYLVAELPSCVSYTVGEKTMHYWRYYLHSLNGAGYYSYPTTMDQLSIKISEAKGTIYRKDSFKFDLINK